MARDLRPALVRLTVFFVFGTEPLAGWINPTITLSSQGDPVIVEAVPCQGDGNQDPRAGSGFACPSFSFPLPLGLHGRRFCSETQSTGPAATQFPCCYEAEPA